MAKAEDGGATTNSNASYGGGGAGGKFRKKPFRKAATPYERPAIALRGNSSSSSWLTKLVVDPASKLISYGARRFFESVFRKRRLPPPPPHQTSESNHVLSDARPDAVLSEHAGGECSKPISSCSNGISDLEQLLKEKTFSRSEIDHLTTLLHSRGGEVSHRDDGKRNDERVPDVGRHKKSENGMGANRNEEDRSHGVDSKVLGHSVASPSELTKAYMGSRPSNLSPSVLGNYSQVTREATKMHSNMRTEPVSMSLTTKSPVCFGSPGNGYIAAPRSLGRSAIYNMARTPYSKRAGINQNGHAGLSVPSTSLTVLENSEKSEPKSMTLKRRSFVLDDEIGSAGSIRRIRQKSNLIARTVPHTDRMGSKSGANPEHIQRIVDENTDVSNPTTSYALVPSKSNGVEVVVGKSKHKSSESNVVSPPQKSTFELMPSMLHGQALRSMEDATSSEFLMNVQDDHKFESNADLSDTHDSAPQDQGKDEENGPIKTSSPSDTYYPGNNSGSAVSFKASLVRGQTSDDVENGLPKPQNKAAFRMSALEDYVDLDDDVPCLELASHPSSDGRGSLEAHRSDSKFPPPEESKNLLTTVQSELKSRPDPVSNETIEANRAVTGAFSLGCNSIITTASQNVTDAARPSIAPPSVAAFDKSKEMNNPPSLFSFAAKAADKFPSLVPDSSSRKPETKPECSSSLLDVFAPSSSPVTFLEPGNGRYAKTLAAEDTNGKSDTVTSAATNGLVASSAPAGSLTATLNNNTHQISTAVPAIFTPSVSVSDFVPSGTGSVSSATSGKISFGASEAPKASGEPPFRFGTSPNPSTNVSAASTTIIPAPSSGSSGSSNINFVSFGLPSTGNMTSRLDSSTDNPSANNSQGSLFGGASKSFLPTVETVSQGTSSHSNSFASNTNSSTSLVASLSSAPVFGQVVPFGFNSSATSSDTGAVASSSGETSSLFGVHSTSVSNGSTGGSSTPSVFRFGLSSSSSSINVVGSTGGATAPVFGAGLTSSGSASVTTGSFSSAPSSTSAVGSTGGAAALVFSFGASSSGSASGTTNSFGSSSSLTNAVGSAGGAAPSTFNFGLSNPVSASASNGASGVFNFGGSSLASTSAINSITSNNAPSNPFGSSLQTPTSSIFGLSPATGFSFGAQATSSAPINAAPAVFNSSTAAPSSLPFLFSSTPASVFASPSQSLSQPLFGNPTPAFATSMPGNNFQMNGEDSMAEDPVQSAAPSGPVFGQANISPSPSGFMLGSAAPSQPNPFQFGGQQNLAAPQNPFQASSSLEFNAGGSFSLGSSGVDKSGRKYVKVNRSKNRKK